MATTLAGMAVLSLGLTGCGGSSSTTATTTASSGNSVISGSLVKGPFRRNAIVRAYKMKRDGSRGDILSQGLVSDDKGTFSLQVAGTYEGPVVLQGYGQHRDEATGLLKTITENAPLESVTAVEKVTSGKLTKKVQINPLTHMVREQIKASAKVTPIVTTSATQALSYIDDKKAVIADAFGLTNVDVLSVEPVLETTTDTEKNANVGMLLAGISQVLNDSFSGDYTRFVTSATGLRGVTDTTNMRNLLNTVTAGVEKVAVSTAFVSEYITGIATSSRINVNALTSAIKTGVKTNIDIPNVYQHIISLNSTVPVTISTIDTLSMIATAIGTDAHVNGRMTFGWKTFKKGTSFVEYASGINPVKVSTSVYSFPFTTNVEGTYKVHVEVKRTAADSKIKTKWVTRTINVKRIGFSKELLMGKSLYTSYFDGGTGRVNYGIASVNADATQLTYTPEAGSVETFTAVTSTPSKTGEFHITPCGQLLLWGTKDTSVVTNIMTKKEAKVYTVKSGSSTLYEKWYLTAAERTAQEAYIFPGITSSTLASTVSSSWFKGKTFYAASSGGFSRNYTFNSAGTQATDSVSGTAVVTYSQNQVNVGTGTAQVRYTVSSVYRDRWYVSGSNGQYAYWLFTSASRDAKYAEMNPTQQAFVSSDLAGKSFRSTMSDAKTAPTEGYATKTFNSNGNTGTEKYYNETGDGSTFNWSMSSNELTYYFGTDSSQAQKCKLYEKTASYLKVKCNPASMPSHQMEYYWWVQ
jgi:hypothetical protein